MNINPALRGKLTVIARGEVSSPAISADGSVVVYNEFKDGETSVLRHEGEDTLKLTQDGHASMHADVNADGSKVVFTRYSNVDLMGPGNYDVALWDEKTGQTSLVSAELGNEMSPQISDDGRVIAWDDDVDGKFGRNDIVKSVDGQTERVTEGRPLDLFPNLSGDGSRLVWRRYQEGKSRVFIQDQNGVVKPYVEKKGNVIRPELSFDGQKMVFADQSGEDEDMMLYNDRTAQTEIVAGVTNVKETWGDISGDGESIAWTGLDFRKGSPADTNVYLRQAGESIQVTTAQGGQNNEPKLSHDGKTLVWTWIDQEQTASRVIYKLELPDS
jgi:Tol biopolymer transport system component